MIFSVHICCNLEAEIIQSMKSRILQAGMYMLVFNKMLNKYFLSICVQLNWFF